VLVQRKMPSCANAGQPRVTAPVRRTPHRHPLKQVGWSPAGPRLTNGCD
jgi:hypothetical protein